MEITNRVANTGVKKDEASELIITQGASVYQLERLFGMDHRTINKIIAQHGIKPNGLKRLGTDLYSVKDIAPYLITPAFSLEEYVDAISTAEKLPPLVRKEFWAGMKARQEYLKSQGELWPTNEVIESIGTLLKSLRMSILLARDQIERETAITPAQRNIINLRIDSALTDMYKSANKALKKGPSFADKEREFDGLEP